MSQHDDITRILEDEADPSAREALSALAMRLEERRPVPSAGFRARLRRELLDRAGAAPARLPMMRRLMAVYASSGTLLLAIAAVGLAGVGPLAA